MSLSRRKVVCLGDSITQQGHDAGGWLGNLQSKYQRSIDIINRGFSGYNTTWLLSILNKLANDFEHADYVFIMMGANDASTDTQTVEIPLFKENLEKIANKVKLAGARNIVLIETPWVSASEWLKFCQEKYPDENHKVSNRNADRAAEYAKAVKEVAKKLEIPLIPLYEKMAAEANPAALLSDGLHFSAAGNKILSDLVEPFLDPIDETQCPEWRDFVVA